MLLWIEGFEAYNAIGSSAYTPMTTKYASLANWPSYFVIRAGRWAGCGLEVYDADINFRTYTLPSTDSYTIMGFNWKVPSIPGSNYTILEFYNGASLGLRFLLTPSGEIRVQDQYGGHIGTTSGAGLTGGVWCHIEIKAYCAAAGWVKIKVDEVFKLESGAWDTRPVTETCYNNYKWSGVPGGSNRMVIDDWFICDSTGTRNNDFLGRKQVVVIKPNAAGDLTQWTPSAGANYACVDEVPPSSSDYVTGDAVDETDLYNFESVPSLTGGVVGIQVNTQAISTVDGVPWNLKTPVKSTTQDDGDATVIVSSTGKYVTRLEEVNHDTGDPWEISELNAAQFGVKLA